MKSICHYLEFSPTKYLYVDQHSNQTEIAKLDQFKEKSINRLIVTTAGHISSSTSGSSDPIVSNGNSSSLSGSEQLTVTDFCPPDFALSSAQNDLLWSQSQYASYGFPFYSLNRNSSNQFHEIVSTKNTKEDSAESGYSTPSKCQYSNKKTVYEVVV